MHVLLGSSDQFDCGDGECIPEELECDDNKDCHDGSDEEGCGKYHVCFEPIHIFTLKI